MNIKSILASFFIIGFFSGLQAQDTRISAYKKQQSILKQGVLQQVEWKNIGPTVFSGRVSDIAVNPKDPTSFYVAYASGGLWYTENNGTTFKPLFDNEAVMTIGDIDVDWEKQIIYVGTGEVNSSRSSYAGVGVYKSSDHGKTWTHLGLEDTHHIGRLAVDQANNNRIFVAALGHLYTDNQARGIYKSEDGGKNWDHVLYINDSTGVVDLIQHPTQINTWYAASWERSRKAWNFKESGSGSAIYKSIDNGNTWKKLTYPDHGFPVGVGTGRIGLTISSDDKIYAIIDNYNRRPVEKKEGSDELEKDDFTNMTVDQFLDLSDDRLESYLRDNEFPKKHDAASVKEMIAARTIAPVDLKIYVEDANRLLFDTPVIGAEVYVSDNGGLEWKKTHEGYLDGLYNSYGYYFGQIRVNPKNSDQLYIMGVPILRSDDGGKTWKNINGKNVHADHHALWINPSNPKHIINGNDGGINISYDAGEHWIKCNMPPVGQFYYINCDNQTPYNVYGGTQDNGVWKGSHQYSEGFRWQMTGDYPYDMIMGGDGMQVQIDSRDPNIVYTGYQFGNYFRLNLQTGDRSSITPKHQLGERPYRWNWQSPILLSSHNQDIVYMGANKVLRSFDQGQSFEAISEDLTNGGRKGDVAYGSLTTIAESPFEFSTLYTGSDDGLIYRTKNGGADWTLISNDLPKNKWISRIVASQHKNGRVYASLNGYRDDDFNSYLYRSDDYGDTWINIAAALPSEPINVVKEDPNHENIIYVGTDHGAYISWDYGNNFDVLSTQIPNVPIHDLVVQPEANDLILGTHGRSIFITNLNEIQSIPDIKDEVVHVFELQERKKRSSWGSQKNQYSEPNQPTLTIPAYARTAGEVKLTIKMGDIEIYNQTYEMSKGLNQLEYHLIIDADQLSKYSEALNKGSEKEINIKPADDGQIYLEPGSYEVVLTKNGKTSSTSLNIK